MTDIKVKSQDKQGNKLSIQKLTSATMPPPQRWEVYQPLGSVIPGTRFIPFKVPLKQEICKNLPENDRFSPEQLVQSIKDLDKSLGLIVDLTFTRKYYNPQYFTHRAIQYEKIFTKGHEVPSDDVFQSFSDIVDDFTSKNADEDILIGVHCTHGINRTGYLVCRYMIEKLNIDPEKAISLFDKSRGHPIEREAYIHDLRQRPKSGNQGASPWDSGSSDRKDRHHWDHSPRTQKPQNHGRKGPSYTEHFPRHRRDYHSWEQDGGNVNSRQAAVPGGPEAQTAACCSQGCSVGYSRSQYMSPLDRLEAIPQSGWGSAARSGWGSGSSYSQDGWSRTGEPNGYKNRNSADPYRDSQRGYHNQQQQQYSWRRPDSANPHAIGDGGRSYRNIPEGFQDSRSFLKTPSHRSRYFANDGSSTWNRGDGGRADRDKNWRHRGSVSEYHRGPGRGTGAEGHHQGGQSNTGWSS